MKTSHLVAVQIKWLISIWNITPDYSWTFSNYQCTVFLFLWTSILLRFYSFPIESPYNPQNMHKIFWKFFEVRGKWEVNSKLTYGSFRNIQNFQWISLMHVTYACKAIVLAKWSKNWRYLPFSSKKYKNDFSFLCCNHVLKISSHCFICNLLASQQGSNKLYTFMAAAFYTYE